MLNIIWITFFLIAFIVSAFKLLVLGDQSIFADIMTAMFALSKTAFEISLGLTGILALWLGIMKIGERSGFIELLTRGLSPLFQRLMPEVPKNHPALGSMVMNISANTLGLDNAATPQCSNSVSGYQHGICYLISNYHLHLPCSARCSKPH